MSGPSVNQGHPVGAYEIIVGTGDTQALTVALQRAAISASTTTPYIIRLVPGLYNLSTYITLPSNTSLRGAGKNLTTIRRTTSSTPITSTSGHTCDPVLYSLNAANISISDVLLQNTSAYDGTNFPAAALLDGCTTVTLSRTRFEGVGKGLAIAAADQANADGTESDRVYMYQCQCVITDGFWSFSVEDREVLAYDCLFFNNSTTPSDVTQRVLAARVWEYAIGRFYNCDFVINYGGTLAPTASLSRSGAFAIDDGTPNGNPEAHLIGCRLLADISSGDINKSDAAFACAVAGGANNTLYLEGCELTYKTGTVTSAGAVCGVYEQADSGNGTNTDVRMSGCSIIDGGGSGGTVRKDTVVQLNKNLVVAQVVPKQFKIYGPAQALTSGYVTGGTDPTNINAVHDKYFASYNSINFQGASATFSTAATAAVTMPIGFQGSATDYAVHIEPSVNETFWVTGKTNTGFTLNSSNATSTATIRYTVHR